MTLYSYVVDHDYGFAPNPYADSCVLSLCKYKKGTHGHRSIQENANVNDWVVGSGGTSAYSSGHNTLIYAMRITRVMPLLEYMKSDEFAAKKRDGYGYEEKFAITELYAVPVLISDDYYYFGANAPQIPENLRSIQKKKQNFKKFDGNKDAAFLSDFFLWLKSFPGTGKIGNPCCPWEKILTLILFILYFALPIDRAICQNLPLPNGYKKDAAVFCDISMENAAKGVALTASGMFYRTSDGGLNWNADSTTLQPNHLQKFNWFNCIERVAAGKYVIMGNSDLLSDMTFNHHGTIMLTSDNGRTWQNVFSDTEMSFSSSAKSGSTVYAIHGGHIIVSSDGREWEPAPSLGHESIQGISFGKDEETLAISQLEIFRGIQGGWEVVPYTVGGPDKKFNAIASMTLPGAGRSTFLIVGGTNFQGQMNDEAYIIYSNDGGASWTRCERLDAESNPPLLSVAFASPMVAVAVGYDGCILRSDYAGLSWTRVPSGVTGKLWKIRFFGPTLGFAVGPYDIIIRTDDAGLTWKQCGIHR